MLEKNRVNHSQFRMILLWLVNLKSNNLVAPERRIKDMNRSTCPGLHLGNVEIGLFWITNLRSGDLFVSFPRKKKRTLDRRLLNYM